MNRGGFPSSGAPASGPAAWPPLLGYAGPEAGAPSRFVAILLVAWLIPAALVAAPPAPRVLDAERHYLGIAGEPEWEEFATRTPHGREFSLRFNAQTNARENTLFIRQDDVRQDWGVELNGRRLGKLFTMEADLLFPLPVPAGVLRDGENTLRLIPPKEQDDIIVGAIQLDPRPLQEALEQATFDIQVTDPEAKKSIPCRITIVDRNGTLTPVYANTNQPLAVRPGVVYTANGKARLGVPPGDYTLYATRGFEFGLATRKLSIAAGQTRQVRMTIRREVPTPGWVSCDTHVHTFTYSRHGDATTEERVITLAGEGIELPIATDHNILTDLSPAAARTGVQEYFTPVIGDEVTTLTAHFNVFPITAGSRAPDSRLEPWSVLFAAIRSTPGVQLAILNHPQNIHNKFQPFARTNFNPVTGESLRVLDFGFDAIELMNSSAQQSDMMLVYRDWFALLNGGHRITGVGSSDGHDVSRYIIGQGRTYVRCRDVDPAAIDVDEACRSLLAGRALVSMGLLTQMTVDDRFAAGDLATGIGETARVTITVSGPSWVRADRVELFANGSRIREQRVTPVARPGEKARVRWTIPRPPHDAHWVAIATGPPVTLPYWAIPKPYQPSSRAWLPRLIGSTNPIWIDGDGDGKFTAARGYATTIVEQTGTDPAKLLPALAGCDEAVSAQAAGLCHASGEDIRSPSFQRALQAAPAAVRRGFAAMAETIPAKPAPKISSRR